MIYDTIVVGAGIAGLTATAFLSKAGQKVLLCEKENHTGGLVNTFERDGFYYDGGIRAIEDSGIVAPMLKQLGISVDFKENLVSIGLGDDIINVESRENINDYEQFLKRSFPKDTTDIESIMGVIKRATDHMDVFYGITNPAFVNIKEDRDFLYKELLPWLAKFIPIARKMNQLKIPVDKFVGGLSANRSLVDLIVQHFFSGMPAFFALGYFRLYLDYKYPVGGTGTLPRKIEECARNHGAEISLRTRITEVAPSSHAVCDEQGDKYEYHQLLWVADTKALYGAIKTADLHTKKVRRRFAKREALIKSKRGGDSVLTIYLSVDIDPSYFAAVSNGHFFYTPVKDGISSIDRAQLDKHLSLLRKNISIDRDRAIADISQWLERFFSLVTYEISIPVLRDEALAPAGKTGLIISVLFDFELVELAAALDWYRGFKEVCEKTITDVLVSTIYPKMHGKIIHRFSSTPKTIARVSGNSDGAIRRNIAAKPIKISTL